MRKHHIIKSNKPAFTMLELTFVIVVLGILAAVGLSRMDRDHRQEAADEILSNIRYTQHMALQDYKQISNNPNWQQRFWQIRFDTCPANGLYYIIGSDNDMDGSGVNLPVEAAFDPLNGKQLYATNATCGNNDIDENILLGKRFGVSLTNTAGGCVGVQHIGFDHLGRPHVSFGASNAANYASYMKQQCIMTFQMGDGQTFNITIEPETGLAEIVTERGTQIGS